MGTSLFVAFEYCIRQFASCNRLNGSSGHRYLIVVYIFNYNTCNAIPILISVPCAAHVTGEAACTLEVHGAGPVC